MTNMEKKIFTIVGAIAIIVTCIATGLDLAWGIINILRGEYGSGLYFISLGIGLFAINMKSIFNIIKKQRKYNKKDM